MVCLFCLNTIQAQTIPKMSIDALNKMLDTVSVPIVVNFWATWCGPCVREIPWFEKGVAAFKNKQVKLLLVSVDFPDEFPNGIRDFMKRKSVKSDVIWLNESDAAVFGPKIDKGFDGSIPVTLMINNKSKYRQFYKQQLTEPQLELALRKLTD